MDENGKTVDAKFYKEELQQVDPIQLPVIRRENVKKTKKTVKKPTRKAKQTAISTILPTIRPQRAASQRATAILFNDKQ